MDFASEGIFLCGLATTPSLSPSPSPSPGGGRPGPGPSCAEPGRPSAASRPTWTDRCAACLVCVRTCPYGVPQINRENVSEINEALCQGCGTCASECPAKVIQVAHFEDDQLSAKIKNLF